MRKRILTTIGLCTALLVWTLLSASGVVSALFLPGPVRVTNALVSLFTHDAFLTDIGVSLARVALGFVLSTLVALPEGIGLGASRTCAALLDPLLSCLRYVPPVVFIPLAIVWFGVGEFEKISIIFIATVPYLTVLIADTIGNQRRALAHVARTLGASRLQVVTRIALPGALPAIWDASRVMIGSSWTFVTAAEMVGASTGLGSVIIASQRFLRTDQIFAVIITIGALGLLTDALFRWSYRAFFPWSEKSHAASQ